MKLALPFLCLAAALTLCLPVLRGAEEPPADPTRAQYDQLTTDYYDGFRKAADAYRQAKPEDQDKVFASLRPKLADYAPRFFALAREHPDTPAAVDALIWVAQQHSQDDSKLPEQALEILRRDYITNEKVGSACLQLVYSYSPSARAFVREVLAKNPHHTAQGFACLGLGQMLRQDDAAGNAKEAEKYFERAASDYADVPVYDGHTIGSMARGELFEIRELVVGKSAPEITGADVDGKPFKLSDYRDKVVVLDFWGRW